MDTDPVIYFLLVHNIMKLVNRNCCMSGSITLRWRPLIPTPVGSS